MLFYEKKLCLQILIENKYFLLIDCYHNFYLIIIPIFIVDQEHNEENIQRMPSMDQNNTITLLYEQTATILAYVKRIDSKLETMEYSTISSNENIDNDFNCMFPMKTVEALQDIEIQLTSDNTFEKKMVIITY